ncbi:MAG: phosphoribosyltransferase [Gordonia sp. (in: high G+C Gram-positive bacteria)]|uniref:phosphoribosyltransferase n=1 Tax=Gordonia sp. (in: high G+C Gram-positive bacteria) TaxID=84139 RepID=UPI0039E44BCB
MNAPSWVTRELGAVLHDDDRSETWPLDRLVVLGLRRNPRRAHLLVSHVLGKHVPVPPNRVRGAADALGDLVVARLGADAAAASTVLGFAETATGLGHCVAERMQAACCLHSTRRTDPAVTVHGGFEEGHSHATSHQLQPSSAALLAPGDGGWTVLVDDEISTGNTALGAVAALEALAPHGRYAVASLVDMRDAEHVAANRRAADELGVTVEFVALCRGRTELPDGLINAVAALAPAELNPSAPDPSAPTAEPSVGSEATAGAAAYVDGRWPAGVPESGRHGFLAGEANAFHRGVTALAGQVAPLLTTGEPVIVVGHEELMYLPLCLAERLAETGFDARVQSTTRSPAYVRDADGYPLRRGFTFPDPEGDREAARYLYNVAAEPGAAPAAVVLVVDRPADTPALRAPGGPVDVLTAAGHRVVVLSVPVVGQAELAARRAGGSISPARELRGPDFGSYQPDEVTWLLKDLSDVDLEADVAERESRIQAGLAHYAESLPVEYQPGPEYRELFDDALAASAGRLAEAVGTVAELILTERAPRPVLVSLARAGTPVGILLQRWIARTHGVVPPHYAVSIVRGRGIDTVALDHLTARHDASALVFVDGWTGKGAIARELADALDAYAAAGGPRCDPELAVPADPGSCTTLFGTRDDFLIPSACLNSTVSGLVSRTVLNAELIGPGDFHGAKFYRELAPYDVSGRLLDTVSAEFDAVAEAVAARVAELRAADRTPTWAGWAAIERIRHEYGLSSINLVKPGIGETTRVLLRRVPWRVLVRDPHAPEHRHIRLLAAERGVPVEVEPDLPYACVGLIREQS